MKSGLQIIFWVLTHCPPNITLFFSIILCPLVQETMPLLSYLLGHRSKVSMRAQRNITVPGVNFTTVTLLLYCQVFTPKHTSLKVTYAWRDPETFLVSFHRNSFWKQKIWLNFACGCLVLKGLFISALYQGLRCIITTQLLLLLVTSQILQNKITRGAIRDVKFFSLLSRNPYKRSISFILFHWRYRLKLFHWIL